MFIKIHIVKQGDTLRTIMKQYDISKQSIEKANPHIANVDLLIAGMKIKITAKAMYLQPQLSTPIPREKSSKQHRIKEEHMMRAHAHERPFNDTIIYDQKWSAYQYEIISSVHLQDNDIQAMCHHCQQPIYHVTY